MNDSMIEHERPIQAKIERNPSLNNILTASDIVVSRGFRNLVSEKAKEVAGVVRRNIGKASLSAAGVSMILSSGCGNIENPPSPTSIPESTPEIQIPISTSPIPVSEPTSIPSATPISKPEITSMPAIAIPTPTHEAISIPEPTKTPGHIFNHTFSSQSIEIPKTPAETSRIVEYRDLGGGTVRAKIGVDKDGLPVNWVLSTGEEVYFDKEEVRKLREKAILSKEPEIIKMLLRESSIGLPEFKYKAGKEIAHPKTLDLPKDVVSEEELESKGITILQPEKSHLFIREGAFAKGGILEDFNNKGRRLIIIFLNGSTISPRYLSDPEYAEIISYLPKEILSAADRRESKIAHAEDYLERFRRDLPAFYAEEYNKESTFLFLKGDIYRHSGNFMTDEQLAKAGEYFKGWYAGQLSQNAPQLLFLSIDQEGYSFPTLYFRHNGDVAIADLNQDFRGRLFPTTTQTHPDPDDFVMNQYASAENKDYIYSGNMHSGFTLRHELSHRALIDERISKGEEPDRSEYSTDKHAMQAIKEAWDKWVKSGYVDDSGYPFVFSLPEEQGGGYVLTKSIASKKEGPSAI